mmetsp:Transcript_9324/g.24104  ORF Transcript_9324/g.24104 Transcript_9324/m.24104 type:complete len:412 (+) Transcript_9324:600-1835(+)
MGVLRLLGRRSSLPVGRRRYTRTRGTAAFAPGAPLRAAAMYASPSRASMPEHNPTRSRVRGGMLRPFPPARPPTSVSGTGVRYVTSEKATRMVVGLSSGEDAMEYERSASGGSASTSAHTGGRLEGNKARSSESHGRSAASCPERLVASSCSARASAGARACSASRRSSGGRGQPALEPRSTCRESASRAVSPSARRCAGTSTPGGGLSGASAPSPSPRPSAASTAATCSGGLVGSTAIESPASYPRSTSEGHSEMSKARLMTRRPSSSKVSQVASHTRAACACCAEPPSACVHASTASPSSSSSASAFASALCGAAVGPLAPAAAPAPAATAEAASVAPLSAAPSALATASASPPSRADSSTPISPAMNGSTVASSRPVPSSASARSMILRAPSLARCVSISRGMAWYWS